jgi:hypothetical protein
MPETSVAKFRAVAAAARKTTTALHNLGTDNNADLTDAQKGELRALRDALNTVLVEKTAPAEITLGRPDGIARFFAFCFANRPKLPLDKLSQNRHFGSGIYAIYYHGTSIAAYSPIATTETPIYVGKADPRDPFAPTPQAQGSALHDRLKEHARSVTRTSNLMLSDFQYRSAPVQSGMQAAVEAFMIQLFRPIWNKEVRVCYGIGKHGDSHETRRNKRSPWDTMHPGRAWAAQTAEDQRSHADIEATIAKHLTAHPVFKTLPELMTHLAI